MYSRTETLGWHASQLRTTLRVGHTLELSQDWSVVADAVLDELVFVLALDEGATVEVLYGGEIVERRRPPENPELHEVVLRLPEPILPGDRCTCALFATWEVADVVSSYVDVVAAPCGFLTMRVKFLPPAIPADVWRLDGVDPSQPFWRWSSPPEVGDPPGDSQPGLSPVVCDGEVELFFTDLRSWCAYGLAWGPSPEPGSAAGGGGRQREPGEAVR